MNRLKEKLKAFFYEIMFVAATFIMLSTYNFHSESLIWILFYVLSILFEILGTYIFIIRVKDNKNSILYISAFLTGIVFFGHLGVFFEIPMLVYLFVILLLSSIIFVK